MKKMFAVISVIVVLSFAFGTAQVFADSNYSGTEESIASYKKGSNGDQTDRKATQEAERQAREDARATDKAERADLQATAKAERAEEKDARKEDKAAGKKVSFRGKVVAVDEASLTVDVGGSEVVFALTDKTVIKIPTVKSATWESLNVGVQVMVQAVKPKDTGKPEVTEEVTEDAGLTEVTDVPEEGEPEVTPVAAEYNALKVMVVPGKPVRIHRVGVVTEYTEGESITIEAKDGNLYTFELSETTKILPKDRVDKLVVGAKVTIISRRDVTGGPLAAQGVVVHPDPSEGDEAEETPEVSETPTETPTNTPTPTPTNTPTETPTEEPTVEPTEEPTEEVTEEPTTEVTEEPTTEVTEEPSLTVTP